MQLEIRQSAKNNWPLAGILIRGEQPRGWLAALTEMGLTLENTTVYPVPGQVANSTWGCFVEIALVSSSELKIGKNEWCQLVNGVLFIPERTVIYPALEPSEIERLFSSGKYLFHPDFGWVSLEEPLRWAAVFQLPEARPLAVLSPMEPVFIPSKINSFRIEPISPEEVLESMEKEMSPPPLDMPDKPLSLAEKAKLTFYKTVLGSKKANAGEAGNSSFGNSFGGAIGGLLDKLMGNINPQWMERMAMDFEELNRRNQKKLDRLMDMFKDNPEEALKYAVPLDKDGVSRGSSTGAEIDLQNRWNLFDLFGGNSFSGNGTGGGAVLDNDSYQRLHNQYMRTAQELMNKKEYYKAAFVYIKLLQNYHLAADALEKGKYYKEAAAIYIKHLNNKQKAAVCFENGFMWKEAIELYKELGDFEKVGDLYALQRKRKEADFYYEKQVEQYRAARQLVKAALIYKNKIGNASLGQDMLLEGWKLNADAYNCLCNYFSNIEEAKDLMPAMSRVYTEYVSNPNYDDFLRVIRHSFERHTVLQEPIRDIAYEIISKMIQSNPWAVGRLNDFQPTDKLIAKDTLRFRTRS